MRETMKPFVRLMDYAEDVHVAFIVEHGDGSRSVAKPLLYQRLEPYEIITEPTMHLSKTEAQRLMDELWNCGLRPSEGSGSAGALAATQQHLADMRVLAFHALQAPKP